MPQEITVQHRADVSRGTEELSKPANDEIDPTIQASVSTSTPEAKHLDDDFSNGLDSFIERMERIINGTTPNSVCWIVTNSLETLKLATKEALRVQVPGRISVSSSVFEKWGV